MDSQLYNNSPWQIAQAVMPNVSWDRISNFLPPGPSGPQAEAVWPQYTPRRGDTSGRDQDQQQSQNQTDAHTHAATKGTKQSMDQAMQSERASESVSQDTVDKLVNYGFFVLATISTYWNGGHQNYGSAAPGTTTPAWSYYYEEEGSDTGKQTGTRQRLKES